MVVLWTSPSALDRLNRQAAGITGEPEAAPTGRGPLLRGRGYLAIHLSESSRFEESKGVAEPSYSHFFFPNHQMNRSFHLSAKVRGRSKHLQLPVAYRHRAFCSHIRHGWAICPLHSETLADWLVHILVITGLWLREKGVGGGPHGGRATPVFFSHSIDQSKLQAQACPQWGVDV